MTWMRQTVAISFLMLMAATTFATKKSAVTSVSKADLKLLETLDKSYRQQSMSMKVERTTKVAIVGSERKNAGTLLISKGRLRMELDGSQKSLLVVNDKTLWAVTFPDEDFQDGKLQVIRADTTSKQGRSQNLLSLLSQGGFLKFFTVAAVEREKNGDSVFFLSPKKEQVDFKSAQVKVSADGKKLLFLKYWDNRDNEVEMAFSDFKPEKSVAKEKFQYTPPSNADVMSI